MRPDRGDILNELLARGDVVDRAATGRTTFQRDVDMLIDVRRHGAMMAFVALGPPRFLPLFERDFPGFAATKRSGGPGGGALSILKKRPQEGVFLTKLLDLSLKLLILSTQFKDDPLRPGSHRELRLENLIPW